MQYLIAILAGIGAGTLVALPFMLGAVFVISRQLRNATKGR